MDKETTLRRIVKEHQAEMIDDVMVDAFTASMLVQIIDALNEKNRKRFLNMPIVRMANMGWELIGKSNER